MLIDTSVIIDLLKGDSEVISFVQHLSSQFICISAVTFAEIEQGFVFLQSKKNQEKRAIFLEMIQNQELRILDVDVPIATQYAKIQSQLLKKGHQLSQFDAIIAATAICNGYTLVSRDRDFQRVAGLTLKLI